MVEEGHTKAAAGARAASDPSMSEIAREVHVATGCDEISNFMDVDRSGMICFRCGEPGHVRYQCLTFKVRLCWHHSAGRCHDAHCPFAHGKEEIRTPWKQRCVRVIKPTVGSCASGATRPSTRSKVPVPGHSHDLRGHACEKPTVFFFAVGASREKGKNQPTAVRALPSRGDVRRPRQLDPRRRLGRHLAEAGPDLRELRPALRASGLLRPDANQRLCHGRRGPSTCHVDTRSCVSGLRTTTELRRSRRWGG